MHHQASAYIGEASTLSDVALAGAWSESVGYGRILNEATKLLHALHSQKPQTKADDAKIQDAKKQQPQLLSLLNESMDISSYLLVTECYHSQDALSTLLVCSEPGQYDPEIGRISADPYA